MKYLPAQYSTHRAVRLCLIFVAIVGPTLVAANDARAAATLSYSLTTQNDPVAPGHVLEFDATVTNLSPTAQVVQLDFIVPNYTTLGGLGGGTPAYYYFGSIPVGQSKTAKLRFRVNDSGNVPSDGTPITLTVTDNARLVSVSRKAIVQSVPVLNLQLSTEQGTVAPGGYFTYTLATANLSASSLSGVTLNATVPKGSSFVSADSGGVLSGKTVIWSLGSLPANDNVQVHATFRASSTPNTPLAPFDTVVSDSAGHIARASDTRVVYATPTFAYNLTATPDSVAPSHVLEFDATVTNLAATAQVVQLDFTVPEYTTFGGLVAGDAGYYYFGLVAPGGSKTAKLRFVVVGSGNIPANGTTITFDGIDLTRGASISRSAVVQAVPSLNLQLSSEQGTVAPGTNFTYTLATANLSGLSVSGTTVSATVPAGASFVSADSGGVLNGGVVTWSLGTLAAGANVQVHATFQASSTPNTPLGPLDAIAIDSASHVARASDTRVVYATPTFAYNVTATPDSVMPGHVLEFDATVTNLAATAQVVQLDFTVPEYTTYGGLVAGDAAYYYFGSVAAGGSKTAKLRFVVVGSGNIPVNGTTITFDGIDLTRGASISRSAVVQALPSLNLQLSSEQGTVAPGANFTYTLAAANLTGGALPNTVLAATVPAGASFISADSGGVLSEGVVTWNLATLRAHANVQVHATFQASSTPNTPLGPLDAIAIDSASHVARASDTRVVYATPTFAYTVTATPDSVMPGHVLEFDATVTNLAATAQVVQLDFTVPEYTTYGGLVAGDAAYYYFGSVAAGGSKTAKLRFVVVGSGNIPANGTTITFDGIDLTRGASTSRSAVVQALPVLTLQLSSEQGTVAPDGNFSYILATANVGAANLPRAMLTASVPAGATFVSADHGGRLSGGLVTWNLGTLGANTNLQVSATFRATSTATALGPVDAVVSDNAGHIARASDTRVIYATPAFSYTITGTPDPVAPGQVLEYDVAVTNLSAVSQVVQVDFTVPEYTTYGGLVGGNATYYYFGLVAAGQSASAQLFFTVVNSGSIPPDGTSITLDVIDVIRGASVSRTVVVDSAAP